MFFPNDVIEYTEAPMRAVRILWVDPTQEFAYVFDLHTTNAWPRQIGVRSLAADLQARRARLLLTDPFLAPSRQDVPDHHRQLQTRAWDVVRALHEHLPNVFLRGWRAKAVAEQARRKGMSRASIMRYLQRYWARGQTPDALLPDYANSGAPGRMRSASAGIKRGRPSTHGGGAPNVDAALRAIFQAAVGNQPAADPIFSRRAAYRAMLAEHFSGCDRTAIPSYGQFIYWIERDSRGTVQDIVR